MKIKWNPGTSLRDQRDGAPCLFLVEDESGVQWQVSRRRCGELGFTEEEISCAAKRHDAFIICPRPNTPTIQQRATDALALVIDNDERELGHVLALATRAICLDDHDIADALQLRYETGLEATTEGDTFDALVIQVTSQLGLSLVDWKDLSQHYIDKAIEAERYNSRA